MDDFRKVSYTQYKEDKPIEATIYSYKEMDLKSKNDQTSMKGKLQPLEDELQPLSKMKLKIERGKSSRVWDIPAESKSTKSYLFRTYM